MILMFTLNKSFYSYGQQDPTYPLEFIATVILPIAG